MKKTIAVALAGICLLSLVAVLSLPAAGQDRGIDRCFNNYERCRQRAFNMDVSWVKMTIVLTGCDIGFGRCLYMGG
jgi:hypothetical protein